MYIKYMMYIKYVDVHQIYVDVHQIYDVHQIKIDYPGSRLNLFSIFINSLCGGRVIFKKGEKKWLHEVRFALTE